MKMHENNKRNAILTEKKKKCTKEIKITAGKGCSSNQEGYRK